MLSYHNDPAIKAKYQTRFARHRAIDAVIQGIRYEAGYKNLGRGCFVGCTLQNYDHFQFPVELGWPVWLAYLVDTIFEGLPADEAPQFGTDLLDAVPVGVDLDPVQYHLAIARHERQIAQLAKYNSFLYESVRNALRDVIIWARGMLSETDPVKAEELRLSATTLERSLVTLGRSTMMLWELELWSKESPLQSANWSLESARWSVRSLRSVQSATRSASAAMRLRWVSGPKQWKEVQNERDTLLTVLRSL